MLGCADWLPSLILRSLRYTVDQFNGGESKIGMGIKDGIIRGIYEINGWEHARDRGRYQFYGVRSGGLDRYRGYTVNHLPQHSVRGPLFYKNC